VLVVSFDARMCRRLGADCSCDDGLAGRDDLSELRLHASRYVWEHFADGLPKVGLDRQAVDPGQPLVDVHIAQIGVKVTEPDRRIVKATR